ncbi:MAG TPA: DUF4325 domain-containing protein [Solirubrobacteraceae bacterium]|nr:DUF4325 domain-containing protein [Solirubrobacteraceae bacterium]
MSDLREKISHAPAEPVLIDFAGVRSVSYSFIDEFLGEFLQAIDDEDAAAPSLVDLPSSAASTIERSLRRRGVDPERYLTGRFQVA